jgi:flagellar hook-associated protein 1 FlgK
LTNNAAKTGMDVATIQNRADTAQDIADTDAINYSNIIGVNLDEELSDMIKYQRAYEASARVFSVASELMQTLVNLAK